MSLGLEPKCCTAAAVKGHAGVWRWCDRLEQGRCVEARLTLASAGRPMAATIKRLMTLLLPTRLVWV